VVSYEHDSLPRMQNDISYVLEQSSIILQDHIGGFSNDLGNPFFALLDSHNYSGNVLIEYQITSDLKKRWSELNLVYDVDAKESIIFSKLKNHNIHPPIDYSNFLCTFNGSAHVSRQLLASVLHKVGLFDVNYCSKNFRTTYGDVESHLRNYNLTDSEVRLYRKFISSDLEFNNNVFTFDYSRFEHTSNIQVLEKQITSSFVHVVSETMADSYYPFVTEKFLYSVVTRGLFVAFAQHGWHSHLEEFYGFKKYDKIFDYAFDDIANPIKRLITMIEMIIKFKSMTTDELMDLYHMEQDTIEYNYDLYFSGNYK